MAAWRAQTSVEEPADKSHTRDSTHKHTHTYAEDTHLPDDSPPGTSPDVYRCIPMTSLTKLHFLTFVHLLFIFIRLLKMPTGGTSQSLPTATVNNPNKRLKASATWVGGLHRHRRAFNHLLSVLPPSSTISSSKEAAGWAIFYLGARHPGTMTTTAGHHDYNGIQAP